MAKLQSLNGTTSKETIYVDVDDEITAIIDKVQAAKGKVIALVLPKRAPVLQSIVNMKLLKRTAETAEKNLVLVTTENGLMPLAGAVGLHVASTPTSKPSVPNAPTLPGDEIEETEESLKIVDGNTDEDNGDFDANAAASKSIGELATAGAASQMDEDDIDESIDMADDGDEPTSDTAERLLKPKKDKKLKVPNFDSFRKKIALGVLGLVVLVVAWIYAFMVMPKAAIAIHTDSSTVTTNLNLTLDTTAKALDTSNDIVPATQQSQPKTSTQQVPATGQQNNGAKATGSVTMSAGSCSSDVPSSVSAGTSLSTNGHTYVLGSSVSFTPTVSHGKCTFVGAGDSGANIPITALKGGADFNVSSASFAVTARSDVTTSGSASGGTDNITKIVTQSDIDAATAKITSGDSDGVKAQLISNIQSKGLIPIPTSFQTGAPQVTTSAKAGDAADNVTVTAITTYTMYAVQKSDIRKLVDTNVNSQIDKGKQVILDDGIANATFTEANAPGDTSAAVSMEVKSVAGPELNLTEIKKQLIGKKSGDIKSYLKQTPGVTSVDVKYSPFWVSVVPKNTSKTTITIIKAGN
ncbi:MAG TPA: hypothetical protein VLG92_02415 [Candidatus Saccharimonadia bacterium]|nr:hypothetical protein [Candidatus Saccharimonadia bacterium]